MNFTYRVNEKGEATITGYTGRPNKNVTIPSVVGECPVTSIGYEAFYGCPSLESITIPDSVTSIGDYAFHDCTSLESITIPDSVTSIGDDAFYGCTSLESITIPDSVTSIGDGAFYWCTSLESERRIYKAFNLKEGKLFCLDCEFAVGEWSKEIDDISLCKCGYHFCTNLFEIFNYYNGKLDKDIAIYECEVGNEVITSDTSKCVTNTIKPVKRLSRLEVLRLLNI